MYYEHCIEQASGGFGEYQSQPINGEGWEDEGALEIEMAQGAADQGAELIELVDGVDEAIDIRGRIHNEPGRVFALVWDDGRVAYTGITEVA